jgi:hypothetical protein
VKKLLFFFCLLPVLAAAQRTAWDIAFNKSIPDSLTQPIRMPPRDYNPHLVYDGGDTVINYKVKNRVVVISSNALYKQFFWRYIYTNDSLQAYKATGGDTWWYNWMQKHHADSLPVIDFSKNELVLYAACAQCLAYCHHDTGNASCHRNACRFRETWFIRARKLVGRGNRLHQ